MFFNKKLKRILFMKIVQSFWTKPLFADEQNVYQNRYNGGWINYRYCLLSMAYSCLTISKVYPELEIYTDDYGIKLLEEELCLPYKAFHADLNVIDLDPALWAYGKLFTYSLQQNSFLHVDNDIFIWGGFPNEIINASVACQNIEQIVPNSTDDYIRALDYMHKKFKSIPRFFSEGENTHAANMGIFGGNDLQFIHHYSVEAMNNVHSMYEDILCSGRNKGRFNVLLEQLFLTKYAQKQNRAICYLLKESETTDITRFLSIEAAQYEGKFMHSLGALKQSPYICEQIEYRMKSDFPEYYNHIVDYLKSKGFSFPINEQSMSKYDDFNDIYSQIKSIKERDDILSKVHVKLKPKYSLEMIDKNLYLQDGIKKHQLKNWGKFLSFFESAATGEEVCQYVKAQKILPSISLEQLRQSVFHLIMQGLYMNKTLDLA